MSKQRKYNTIANNSSSGFSNTDLRLNDFNQSNIDNNKIGDFGNLKGCSIKELLKRIPAYAVKRVFKPNPNGIQEGYEYKWIYNNKTWRVEIHSSDPAAPIGNNAHNGWVFRVQKGKKRMDSAGNFHKASIFKKDSPNYDEDIANDSHIPIIMDISK